MSDADAEERGAARGGEADGVVDALGAQPRHSGRETADARQHDFPCVGDDGRIGGHAQIGAGLTQRSRDVGDVGDRRVDERYFHQITPLVLGTPPPTICFASRSAIAKALKIASAA